MRYKIKYYSIQSDHILAVPQFSHEEVIQSDSITKVRRYVELQKDEYGNHYKKGGKDFGFDYQSKAGAVKIKRYVAPKIRRI